MSTASGPAVTPPDFPTSTGLPALGSSPQFLVRDGHHFENLGGGAVRSTCSQGRGTGDKDKVLWGPEDSINSADEEEKEEEWILGKTQDSLCDVRCGRQGTGALERDMFISFSFLICSAFSVIQNLGYTRDNDDGEGDFDDGKHLHTLWPLTGVRCYFRLYIYQCI